MRAKKYSMEFKRDVLAMAAGGGRTVEHRDSSADGKQRKRVRQFHGHSARRWNGDGLL